MDIKHVIVQWDVYEGSLVLLTCLCKWPLSGTKQYYSNRETAYSSYEGQSSKLKEFMAINSLSQQEH